MSEQVIAVTAREVDAWIAEHVMGWTDVYPHFEHAREIGFGIPPDGKYGFLIPSYTKDANDDAAVRARLNEPDCWPSERHDISLAVWKLWNNRSKICSAGPWTGGPRHELPGDWTLAAYAVGKGLDVLELERMVRG